LSVSGAAKPDFDAVLAQPRHIAPMFKPFVKGHPLE
jgi:hypothetical protein